MREDYNLFLLFPNCADLPRYGVSLPVVSCTRTKNQALNHSQIQWTLTLPGAQRNADQINGGSRVLRIHKSQKRLHKRSENIDLSMLGLKKTHGCQKKNFFFFFFFFFFLFVFMCVWGGGVFVCHEQLSLQLYL